jgi:aerobic-type carbon monoxide dehydrogenase small subunit (CoxS/CutS family)
VQTNDMWARVTRDRGRRVALMLTEVLVCVCVCEQARVAVRLLHTGVCHVHVCTFSKVVSIVALCSKFISPLTVESVLFIYRYSLLRNNATPSAAEVEHSIDGNLCRCTGMPM